MDDQLNNSDEVVLPVDFRRKKRWYRRWWAIILWLFLLLIIVIVSILGWQTWYYYRLIKSGQLTTGQNNNQNNVATSTVDLTALRQQLELSSAPYWGNPQAKVVVVEFGDFECPYCLQEFPIIRQIMYKYQAQVKFIWRDFPISENHPQAIVSAKAAHCADEQGKFWQMHDKLFINQANLEVAALKEYAKQLNLDMVKFNQCLDSEKYKNQITLDYAEGLKFGVPGTPTFFINGQKVPGVIQVTFWDQLLTKLIAENK